MKDLESEYPTKLSANVTNVEPFVTGIQIVSTINATYFLFSVQHVQKNITNVAASVVRTSIYYRKIEKMNLPER